MEGKGWNCRFVLLTIKFCDVVVEIIRGVGTSILVCGTVSGRWHKNKSVLFCVSDHREGILQALVLDGAGCRRYSL